MLSELPVMIEHLEEHLFENIQKAVDGTVGLEVENHLLNYKITQIFRLAVY